MTITKGGPIRVSFGALLIYGFGWFLYSVSFRHSDDVTGHGVGKGHNTGSHQTLVAGQAEIRELHDVEGEVQPGMFDNPDCLRHVLPISRTQFCLTTTTLEERDGADGGE